MLLIGDDWAEDHHDVEVQDATGRKPAAARLPEGVDGVAKAHKSYAGTSPITRASGKSHSVQARFVRNNRLADALRTQVFSVLRASPGTRRYYDKQRAREAGYNPALRQLGNRLVGILHGCLKTRTLYDEATAWQHHTHTPAA
ncbi:hypothetical protein [Streptomyces sp. WZ.A104]|uniref:hypothetical protein n=1 Tax=Streptomyces sp. WZ.A104 TaxID=2023771 RepID=UPI001C54276E|nr:hypothetical protein [Streptomyces sp. WZ.A104]